MDVSVGGDAGLLLRSAQRRDMLSGLQKDEGVP